MKGVWGGIGQSIDDVSLIVRKKGSRPPGLERKIMERWLLRNEKEREGRETERER